MSGFGTLHKYPRTRPHEQGDLVPFGASVAITECTKRTSRSAVLTARGEVVLFLL
jgi:hypothetical protein